MDKYPAPQPINSTHLVGDFDCGEESMNNWLKNKALNNEINNNSRTSVVCVENTIIAYYSLCTGCIYHKNLSRKFKHRSPDPIPSLVLGRLAIDLKYQGQGLSKDLIKEIYIKTFKLSQIVAMKVLVVNALNSEIVSFYQKLGFVLSKTDPLLLLKSVDQIQADCKAAGIT